MNVVSGCDQFTIMYLYLFTEHLGVLYYTLIPDNIMTVKQRYRSGKRPFRTFHKSSVKSHFGYSTIAIEYDETDNDELTIFESWATETFVRMEEELSSTEVTEKVNKMQDQLEQIESNIRRQNDLFSLFHGKMHELTQRIVCSIY